MVLAGNPILIVRQIFYSNLNAKPELADASGGGGAASRVHAAPGIVAIRVRVRPSDSCRACHAGIAESYRHGAMARSLYRPTHANVIEDYQRINTFYHAASGRHYRMTERQGRFYQQRFQLDARGRETNAMEVEVTYITGSGNHARSYLHLSQAGELTELPITPGLATAHLGLGVALGESGRLTIWRACSLLQASGWMCASRRLRDSISRRPPGHLHRGVCPRLNPGSAILTDVPGRFVSI
jgi:hypothetical protein